MGDGPQPTTLEESQLILDTLPEAYLRVDKDFRFTFANREAERHLRRTRAEIIGKTPWEVEPACAGTALENGLRRAMAERIPVTFRNFFEPWQRWYSIAAIPDERGGIVVHFRDETERVKLQEDVAASAERLRLTQECAEVGIWTANPATGEFDASPIAKRLHGLSETADLDISTAMAAVHPEDRRRVEGLFSKAMAESAPYSAEYRTLWPDGTLRWLLAQGRFITDSQSGALQLFGVVQDITDRRNSEERFSKVFLSNPAAMSIVDLEKRSYVDVNSAFERVSGYCREEVVGQRWDDLALWDDPDARDEASRRLLETGTLRNLELRFRSKTGNTHWGIISAELITVGGRAYAVTATIDVTEWKRAEAERNELARQLQQAQKLESVGRLAGGIAHDFNNLLMIINGYSASLADALKHHPLCWQVDEISTAGERAASLTSQLLAFSRRQTFAPKQLDLNAVISGAEQMLRRLIGEDVEVVASLGPDLWPVTADADQIVQVIVNLAVNARDAMPHGGKIIIGTQNVEIGPEYALHVEAKPGPHVLLTFTDTGEGMSAETLEHAFEPFFTTKPLGRGTGLGLSLVYGIVRQSGGWVEASSEPGHGAAFRIYLPRSGMSSDVSQVGSAVTPARTTLPHGSETILLVEDQDGVRKLTASMLSTCGYRVLEAGNAREALEINESHSEEIDLLLTDVVLPGLNGKELADKLRLSRPKLLVLFMSGYTADIVGHRGVLESGVAYIQKPFRASALAAQVRAVLEGRGRVSS